MDDSELVEIARETAEQAYAPYSDYYVGAALLTADGTVFTGCNVENANLTNSVHAEGMAVGEAIREGHREFDRIAVSSAARDGVTPCGLCRQTLSEFCDEEFRVLCDDDGEIVEYRLGTLLPNAIDRETLDEN